MSQYARLDDDINAPHPGVAGWEMGARSIGRCGDRGERGKTYGLKDDRWDDKSTICEECTVEAGVGCDLRESSWCVKHVAKRRRPVPRVDGTKKRKER